jgi:hypothetical protein
MKNTETAKSITDELIKKVKKMKEYEVIIPVPDDFAFNGVVPFDLTIRGDIMVFTVLAGDYDEASAMVEKYIDDNTTV